MQIKYDKSIDALYISIKKGKVFKTKEQGGSIVDYDKNGDLLGLEILNYSKKVRPLKGLTMGTLKKQAMV